MNVYSIFCFTKISSSFQSHLVSATASMALTPLLSNTALDWKSFRHLKECSCSTPFDHFSRKVSKALICFIIRFFFGVLVLTQFLMIKKHHNIYRFSYGNQ